MLHGYWSTAQYIQNKVYYLYKNEKGEEIKVTQVNKDKMEDIKKNFIDNKYVDKCVKFIRAVRDK